MHDFDFSSMEKQQVTVNKSAVTKKTKKLYFEEKNEDGELLVLVKKLINSRDLSYSDVYDKYGKQLGINMINGIRKGQISWDRFKLWLDLLEVDYDLVLTPRNQTKNL